MIDKWELLKSYIKGAADATHNENTDGVLNDALKYMTELEENERQYYANLMSRQKNGIESKTV